MKDFGEDLKRIYKDERWMLALMILNLLASLALFIFSITHLNSNSSVVKIGYDDIGGYHDGIWSDMLVFPILAIILGIFHNLIAVKIFHKRGAGVTKFFLIATATIILGAFVVLIRLLREG